MFNIHKRDFKNIVKKIGFCFISYYAWFTPKASLHSTGIKMIKDCCTKQVKTIKQARLRYWGIGLITVLHIYCDVKVITSIVMLSSVISILCRKNGSRCIILCYITRTSSGVGILIYVNIVTFSCCILCVFFCSWSIAAIKHRKRTLLLYHILKDHHILPRACLAFGGQDLSTHHCSVLATLFSLGLGLESLFSLGSLPQTIWSSDERTISITNIRQDVKQRTMLEY